MFTKASRREEFDFVEALVYSKNSAVVMVGQMVSIQQAQYYNASLNLPTQRINSIGQFWKPWFFKHVEHQMTLSNVEDEDSLKQQNMNRLESLLTFYTTGAVIHGPVSSSSMDLIPLRDYYHRHTRSIFWELQDIIPFGNEAWFRYLLGWAVPPNIGLLKLTTTDKLREIYSKAHVVQV